MIKVKNRAVERHIELEKNMYMHYIVGMTILGVFRIRPALVRGWLHAEDNRWPRKSSIKQINANEEFALAA